MWEQLGIGYIVSATSGLFRHICGTFAKWVCALRGGTQLSYTVFADAKAALPDVIREMTSSNSLRIMAGRGNFLLRNDSPNPYHEYIQNPDKKVIILLPDIYNRCKKQDWIKQRAIEMSSVADTSIHSDTQLVEEIRLVTGMIRNIVVGYSIDESHRFVACFDSLHLGRITLLDAVVYFQPYQSDRKGEEGPVLKFHKTTNPNIYLWLERVFDKTREYSTPINVSRCTIACGDCHTTQGGD